MKQNLEAYTWIPSAWLFGSGWRDQRQWTHIWQTVEEAEADARQHGEDALVCKITLSPLSRIKVEQSWSFE